MTVSELVIHLHAKGVVLSLDGGVLRFRGSRDALTARIQAAMARHKSALISRLQTGNLASPEDLPAQWKDEYRIQRDLRDFYGEEPAEAEAHALANTLWRLSWSHPRALPELPAETTRYDWLIRLRREAAQATKDGRHDEARRFLDKIAELTRPRCCAEPPNRYDETRLS